MKLCLLSGSFAVCRLEPGAAVPGWATGHFVSITRTAEELSIVCDQSHVPDGIQAEPGWRCFRVAGKVDFSMVGVIAELTRVLAEAEVSVFVVSSYDTDFVLVRDADVSKSIEALRRVRHVGEDT